MKRLLFLLCLFPSLSLAAPRRNVTDPNLSKQAEQAINLNFLHTAQDSEVVHKSKTEKITGDKTFTGDVTFSTITVTSATVTNLTVTSTSTLQGPVVLSSAIGSGTPAANTLYSEMVPKVIARIANSGTPSCSYCVNVTSLTDVAAGQVRVNFLRDFASTSYVCTATAQNNAAPTVAFFDGTPTAHNILIFTQNSTSGASVDSNFYLACFGPQ